jgi:hypothetical protein
LEVRKMRTKLVVGMLALLVAAGSAPAQDEKKKAAAGPLGLPSTAVLKEKCSLNDEQLKKCEEIYASYKDKVAEAIKKVKDAAEADKKAAAKARNDLKTEISGKIREALPDDDKRKIFDELAGPKKKAAEGK